MKSSLTYSSSKQMLFSLLASVGFLLLCVWMLTFTSIAQEKKLLFFFIAFVALPFFSYSAFISLKRLISKSPILDINQKGITDYASGLSVGFIPWSDIIGAEITSIKKQKYLHIYLKNPQEYIKKAALVRRLLLKINVAFGSSYLSIVQSTMSEKLEDILAKINQFKQIEEKKSTDRANRFSRK